MTNPWGIRGSRDIARAPRYVAVGGTTGSGKSTLVAALSNTFSRHFGCPYEAVNERTFHHPILSQMFSCPEEYAFHIQAHFLLQRSLFIRHAVLTSGRFVIERSHHEDKLFAHEHWSGGNISDSQLHAYEALRRELHAVLPEPEIYVRLTVQVSTSIDRIKDDEAHGRRPEEFPSQAVLRSYVHSWARMYAEFFAKIDSDEPGGYMTNTLVLDPPPQGTPEATAAWVLTEWLEKCELYAP